MTAQSGRKDLVVLVADRHTEATISGLLSRRQALAIRAVTFDLFVHPERDPGCLRKSRVFLQAQSNNYAYALVVFDRDGCGRENDARVELEQQVERELEEGGWAGRASVIVIDPELEVWVWSQSPEVDRALGWSLRKPDLRTWLQSRKLLPERRQKPSDPKEALEEALRHVRKPPSAAIFAQLAGQVSTQRCTDGAFVKLRDTLQAWFGAEPRVGPSL